MVGLSRKSKGSMFRRAELTRYRTNKGWLVTP
jgi:hypothetical protein